MHLRLLAPAAVLAFAGVAAAGFDAEPVGEVVARAAALDHLRVTALLVPTSTTRAPLDVGGRLVDAYHVQVLAASPLAAAQVSVAAATGRVVAVRSL
jgi:hypothetical protein